MVRPQAVLPIPEADPGSELLSRAVSGVAAEGSGACLRNSRPLCI